MFNLVVDSEVASERNFRTEISVRTGNKLSTNCTGTCGQKAMHVRIYVRDKAHRERETKREKERERERERPAEKSAMKALSDKRAKRVG